MKRPININDNFSLYLFIGMSVIQILILNFTDITIHDPKTNNDFPNLTEDNGKLTDFIYFQIHFFISQLHQHGKLHPEQISQRL
jgi:hypothetical protein